MKCFIRTVLLVFMFLSFIPFLFGCEKQESYVIASGDTGFDRSMIICLADHISRSSESVTADKVLYLAKLLLTAHNKVAENKITVDSSIKEKYISLADNDWDLFRSHYKEIGIEKSVLTQINELKAEKDQLFFSYYGKGGKKEIDTEDIRKIFDDDYAGFKYFTTSFATDSEGNTVTLTEQEKQEIKDEFENYASKINNGKDIDNVYRDFCTHRDIIVTDNLPLNITRNDFDDFGQGFSEKLKTLAVGRADTLIIDDDIYLIYRCDTRENTEEYFNEHYNDLLLEYKSGEFEKQLISDSKKIEIHCNDAVLSQLIKSK